MRGDSNQNHYTNYDHSEGSSNNRGIGSSFDQDSLNGVNLNLHPQGCSPIGLNLRKSNSLINLVEMMLSQEKERKTTFQRTPEKLKASNFPALVIQIGTWKRISINEGDLVAKVYYAKKKLVWEFLDGPLKNKIEIQWSEISAIRAFTDEGELGHLQIELNQPPQFGRETNPQPRKHTQWKQTMDFTGGQASVCRRHSIIFSPGVLNKQYEKLLQCDNRLFSLSQKSFLVNNYPYFIHEPNHSYKNVNRQQPNRFLGDYDYDSTISALRFEEPIRHTNESWSRFEDIPSIPIGLQDHFQPYYGHESMISVQQSQTKAFLQETDYVNNEILSGIEIQEPNSWIGVPNVYGVAWETGMEEVGCLNVNNQHYNPNWT